MTGLSGALTVAAIVAVPAVVVGPLRVIGGMVTAIAETPADTVAPGHVQGRGLESELDALLRS